MFGKKKKTDDKQNIDISGLNDELYQGSLENKSAPGEGYKTTCFPSYSDSVDQLPRQVYGGFWQRLLAYCLDYLFIKALVSILLALASLFLSRDLLEQGDLVNFLAVNFIWVLYFTLSTYLLNGQSLGKFFCRLRVVKADESRLSLGTCLIREGLGKAILRQFPILALVIVFTPKRENFIDFFTDTRVLSLSQMDLINYPSPSKS